MTGLAENGDHARCCLDELTSHTVGVPELMRDAGVVMQVKGVSLSLRALVSPFCTLLPITFQRRYRQHSGCYPIEEDLGL